MQNQSSQPPSNLPPIAPPPGEPPTAKKFGRIGKVLLFIGAVVVLMVVAVFLQRGKMGTQYKVNDKESVYYSGAATEDDAKRLGEVLKTFGFFEGEKEKDVLIKKDEKEGTIISFVVVEKHDDPAVVAAFQIIGAGIKAEGFGNLTMRLVDPELKTLKEIKVE